MKEQFGQYDLIVIGAGASGLYFAASKPVTRGLILEKTKRPGTKFLMSGGGHCNITHEGSIKDFVTRYGASGPKIRKILYTHSNQELIRWFEQAGIRTVTEEDGRVFPQSKNAGEVLSYLLKSAENNNYEIRTESPVVSISKLNSEGSYPTWVITCQTVSGTIEYLAKNVIIATGGCSYPSTGSDGSMLNILSRDLSVPVIQPKPGLAPIQVEDYPYGDLAGISMDAIIKINGIKDRKFDGPLLFTHNGFSGPSILNSSNYLSPKDIIKINYLRGATYEEAFSQLQAASLGSKASMGKIIAKQFNLPQAFSRAIEERAAGSTKKAAELLTGDEFTIKSLGSFDNAMVTLGGVSLDEVNLATMELKSHTGIFVIGEALDVAGETGGYNLQFAYSSAKTASLTQGQR